MCANAVRVEISAWPWHGRRISLQTFYRSVVIAKPTKFNASSAWCCFHHQCCRSLTRPTKSTKSLRYTKQYKQYTSHQLFMPRHNLSFGSRAFSFSAPRTWNSLPLRIRETQSLPAFKRHLKTHFSSQLTHPLATHHPTRPNSLTNFGSI